MADQSGALRVMLMGFSMTIPMVAWMAYRRHRPRRNAEMAASMLVPSVAAAALAAAGVLGAGAALVIQHGLMVPAMLGVMLWRYEEYARPHGNPLVTAATRRTWGRRLVVTPSKEIP